MSGDSIYLRIKVTLIAPSDVGHCLDFSQRVTHESLILLRNFLARPAIVVEPIAKALYSLVVDSRS